jgi:protein-tyrosine-phosphatase
LPAIPKVKLPKDYLYDESLYAPTPLFKLWHDWHKDTAFVYQPFLAMLAACPVFGLCMGSGYRGHTGQKANPYMVALAGTGLGKENPRRMGMHLLSALGMSMQLGASKWGSDAGFEREMSGGDIIWFPDEMHTTIKVWGSTNCPSYKLGIKDMLLECSNGGRYNGRSLKDGNEQLIIDDPMPIIFGTSQPVLFFGTLTAELITQGFVNRTMVFDAARNEVSSYRSGQKDSPDRIKLIPEACPKAMVDIIAQARKTEVDSACRVAGIKRPLNRYHLSKGADEALKEIHYQIEEQKVKAINANDAHTSALIARVMEKLTKMAMIHAWSKNPKDLCMDVDSIDWANRIVQISEQTIARECPTLRQTGTEFEGDFNFILAKIKSAGDKGIPQSDLIRSRRMPRPRFQDILTTLAGTRNITIITGANNKGTLIKYLDNDE